MAVKNFSLHNFDFIEYLKFNDVKQNIVLKRAFFKKALLNVVKKYKQHQATLPKELMGFVMALEVELTSLNTDNWTEADCHTCLTHLITRVREREALHPYWQAHALPSQRLSYLLEQLLSRLFMPLPLLARSVVLPEAANDIESSIDETLAQVQAQLQKDLHEQAVEYVMQTVETLWQQYQASCFWPIKAQRLQQKTQLTEALQQTDTPQAAMRCFYHCIERFEHDYYATSLAANLTFYQRQSRFVHKLRVGYNQLLATLKSEYKPQESTVVRRVTEAIQTYLSHDRFYHNRQRRRMAQQLLQQLREDQACSDMLPLQKKYQLRATLDDFIEQIDRDFAEQALFYRFTPTRRSRLTQQLEKAKQSLIAQGHLASLNMVNDVKQPIICHLRMLSDQLLSRLKTLAPAQMNAAKRQFSALINAVDEAQSREAIESLLEAHSRSCYQAEAQQSFWDDLNLQLQNLLKGCDDAYFVVGMQLEAAVIEWQSQGVLPANTGYKGFLTRLSHEHEHNIAALAQLFQRYDLPMCFSDLKAYIEQQQTHARQLYARAQQLTRKT